ncbi:unnamed protein product, partial [Ixodes hexagonus]
LRKAQATDHTEENLKTLQKLSHGCSRAINKANLHTMMHRQGADVSASTSSSEDRPTAFTDEDFRRFEEEYHIS